MAGFPDDWKTNFLGPEALELLLEGLTHIDAELAEGRTAAAAHRLFRCRWMDRIELTEVPREVVADLNRHSTLARSALLKHPPDIERAVAELAEIRALLLD
jgi:hypothetical protein